MRAFALVIGNSDYLDHELNNPVNDATDFGSILERLGFKVNLKVNVKKQELDREIDSFGKELENYDIGLFYFAGHGIQIDGENFLTVIDTSFESETAVQYSSITLNKVLTYMERAENKTNIIILDACRDNPFEKTWNRSISEKGLAPMYAPKGTLIAYATSPGQKAKDGTGRNGQYTSALLKHIEDENITVEEFFKRVRNSVFAFTNGKQTSWEHTSLTGTFIFNTGQLIHSINTPYSTQAVCDKEAILDKEDELDKIIIELKSHNWYTQNPAIDRIPQLIAKSCDKNKLFLLGRNILQCAEGGAKKAISIMENPEPFLNQFSVSGENHVLNGMLFEVYFNSEGKFRGDNIKGFFLEQLASLTKVSQLNPSFEFIQQQLEKFRNTMLYIPSKNNQKLAFDVFLEKREIKHDQLTSEEYFVKRIIFEGEDILKPNERNPFFGDQTTIAYDPILYENLKSEIAQLANIPINLIIMNTNHELKNGDRIKFPLGHLIKKN